MSREKINIRSTASFYYLLEIRKFFKNNSDFLKVQPKTPYRKLFKFKKMLLSTPLDELDLTKTYEDFHEIMRLLAEHELKTDSSSCHKKSKDREHLNDLFIKTYENNSQIDQFLYLRLVKDNANKKSLETKLASHTNNPTTMNPKHPDNKGNAFVKSMLGLAGYDPTAENNIPYIAFDEQSLPNGRTCIHIGAQTRNKDDLHPTFQRYLLAKAEKAKNKVSQYEYSYVYFNLMKRQQDTQTHSRKTLVDNFVRNSEGGRSTALQSLNNDEKFKTAVITLPADNKLFLGSFSKSKGIGKKSSQEKLEDLFENIKKSVINNENDFFMPNIVKEKLFGNFENNTFKDLFDTAVKDVLGHTPVNVNAEQRQAVLFHFVKFTLTNHILDTLNPHAYNISCKDAIDRGAIHSLWYHLNLMHRLGKPMAESEFLKHLYAPAVLVKYRSINENVNLIWNALIHRMQNNSFSKSHPWAVNWLEANAPAKQRHRASSFENVNIGQINDLVSSPSVSPRSFSPYFDAGASSSGGSSSASPVYQNEEADLFRKIEGFHKALLDFKTNYDNLADRKNTPGNETVRKMVSMFEYRHLDNVRIIVEDMINSIENIPADSKKQSILLRKLSRDVNSIKILSASSKDIQSFHAHIEMRLNDLKKSFNQNQDHAHTFSRRTF